MFPTSRSFKAEVRHRRLHAARAVLVSAAPLLGLAVAVPVFGGGGGPVLLGAVVCALLALPVLRSVRILRGRGHFQPFLLVLLSAACVAQVIAAAVSLASGTTGAAVLLALWALVTAAAARLVQRSHLVT